MEKGKKCELLLSKAQICKDGIFRAQGAQGIQNFAQPADERCHISLERTQTASLQIEAMRYFPSVLMIYSYKIPRMWLDRQAKPLLQYKHIQEKHNRCGMWKPRDHYLLNTRGTEWQVSSLTYACPSTSSLNVAA